MLYTNKEFGQKLSMLVAQVSHKNLKNKTMLYLIDYAQASVSTANGETFPAYPTVVVLQHAGLPAIKMMFFENKGLIECTFKYEIEPTKEGNVVFPRPHILNATSVHEAFEQALLAAGGVTSIPNDPFDKSITI